VIRVGIAVRRCDETGQLITGLEIQVAAEDRESKGVFVDALLEKSCGLFGLLRSYSNARPRRVEMDISNSNLRSAYSHIGPRNHTAIWTRDLKSYDEPFHH